MKLNIVDEIKALKEEMKVQILAHYYESPEIQDLADTVGDSYVLARAGQLSESTHILLAGVVFMAESVKILSPEKTVLVPDLAAGCSLVSESPADKYLQWRRQYPDGIAVTYINSSAQVKAISDVIVTSSNAKKIVAAIPRERPILFGPDRNLGRYLARELKRDMIIWPGACQVHVLFSARRLYEMMRDHPDAVVIAHPECDEQVLAAASVIGSTSRLLDEVTKNPALKFIVGTETGIFHQMKRARPDALILQAPTEDKTCQCNDCPYMKLNTLEKIRSALQSLSPRVEVPLPVRERAWISLSRMVQISEGQCVQWPERFEAVATPPLN
ncbi:MAG: quinolinate synthase [Bdellovibrio sp.]|nr:MAG: quinolinate synthase [Bdellovibrio sp.]